eukprot:11168599-Lingulodinium_polyedra.AAC.1
MARARAPEHLCCIKRGHGARQTPQEEPRPSPRTPCNAHNATPPTARATAWRAGDPPAGARLRSARWR